MRRINLKDYTEVVRDEESGKDVKLPYPVKDSMVEVLLSRELGLLAREALDREDLARKIRDCPDGSILLEEEEWKKLQTAVDTIKGWCRTDLEFLHRIIDAPEVPVEEKKPEEV